MLNPFIELIGSVIHMYSMVVIVWLVMSLLIQFEIMKRFNPLVNKVFSVLSQMVDPVLEPIRRRLRRWFPRLWSIDLSPLVLLLLLNFINSALYNWFYTI